MAAKKKKRTARRKTKVKTVSPVKVNAAIQKQYRERLQASNQRYKKLVNKKVNALLKQIEGLDRSKPGAFQKQADKIMKSIKGLDKNLTAANKRSIKAVEQFTARMNKENMRRTKNSFGKTMDFKLQEFQLQQKAKVVAKNVARLEKSYVKSIVAANRDYSDRVQAALYEKLGNPRINARKKIIKAKGIVTRRIKNTVANQAHELNASMNRTRQAALGAKRYAWATKGDEKVRPLHVVMGAPPNNIYAWNKRPQPTGHPGEDHGCRCNAIPILDN